MDDVGQEYYLNAYLQQARMNMLVFNSAFKIQDQIVPQQKLDELSDEELLGEIASSSDHASAFEILYQRQYPGLFRLVYYKYHKRDVAEMLAQDVMTKVYADYERINKKRLAEEAAGRTFNLSAYITRMGRNVLNDYIRASIKRREKNEEYIQEMATLEKDREEFDAQEELDQKQKTSRAKSEFLVRCLTQLSDRQSEVIRLRLAGLKYKEISDVMEISVDTVKEYRKISLDKLKVWFQEEFVE